MNCLSFDTGWRRRLGSLALLSLLAAALLLPSSAFAAGGGQEINFFMLAMNLFGGLAIFLYGMEKMSGALKRVAGERMKDILGKLTTNRFMGMITGAFVTAVIQSSSVTTVLLVGFVTAGLMSLAQAVGVILGANIGTTITAQIIAFKVTKYAALMIAGGFVMSMAGKEDKTKQYGHMIMGLGLIFFGMALMSGAMKPLRSYEPFLLLMQNVSNPIIGIAVAAAFTALVQSSSATTGVILALSMQGLISLEAGIALILGANIGTCVTAGLAAIGKPREAVRVAVAHVTFNVVGALIIIWLIPVFAEFVRSVSPAAPHLTGLDRLAAEVPRQVANAHSLFNVAMALLFVPFAGLLARFCEKVVPDRPMVEGSEPSDVAYQPRYLDEELISTPALALNMVRREVKIMGGTLEQMIRGIPEAVLDGDLDKTRALCRLDDRVDAIHEAITRYLSRVGSQNLSGPDADRVLAAVTASTELESMGDIVENNLAHLAEVRARDGIDLGQEARDALSGYLDNVLSAVRSAVIAFADDDRNAARRVMAMKDSIRRMDAECHASQVQAMQSQTGVENIAVYALQADIRENLKRIYYHAKRVAKLEARVEGAAAWTSNMASQGSLLPFEKVAVRTGS
ncbi:MAG: Na/Pi cotransporter family protein [Gammaproteobacteria bacterium]|nr:Na/Pi cotransporter family protein [Gammaproteobacteria bacterium]